MIYFDNNATMPMLPEARDAWLRASLELIGNPSSLHRAGARAEAAVEEARRELAAIFGCSPAQIIWTSGATESNNIVINHFRNKPLLISAIEHPSVLSPAQVAGNVEYIPVKTNGLVDLEWLDQRLSKDKPGLVAVMSVNNETGIVQPWTQVTELCRNYGVAYLCDATQSIGKAPVHQLGTADLVSGCGHKFGGPKGTGFLKVPDLKLSPFIRGGEQEAGVRSGTENVAGIISMLAGLKAALEHAKNASLFVAWRDEFEEKLMRRIQGVEILGRSEQRIWNTSSVLMPNENCRARWVVKLDRYGFAVSTGSACASGKEKPSHVLSAMGIAPERAAHALRFSSGWQTTKEDWQKLLETLVTISRES